MKKCDELVLMPPLGFDDVRERADGTKAGNHGSIDCFRVSFVFKRRNKRPMRIVRDGLCHGVFRSQQGEGEADKEDGSEVGFHGVFP